MTDELENQGQGNQDDQANAGQSRSLDEVERESRGRLREIQDLRNEKRSLEQRLAELSAKADAGTSTAAEDDEAFVTTKNLKELREQLKEEIIEEQKAESEARQQQRLLEDEARMKAATSKLPEGLAYEEVIAEGKPDLSQRDWEKIRASENPAKTAYELCLKRNDNLRRLAEKHSSGRRGGASESVLLGGGERRTARRAAVDDDGGEDLGELAPDVIEGMTEKQLDALLRKVSTRV